MKKNILFVDDEIKVLDGLKRMLRSMRHEWEMTFVDSGREAIAVLSKQPFDVVVSDMRMPDIDGAQLMTEIMKKYPKIIRIILSGYSDQKTVLSSIKLAHQYLSKPCDVQTLKMTIDKVLALRGMLENDLFKAVVAKVGSLPSLPSLYQEIMTELKSESPSIHNIANIISKDVSMTAKILQVINSAFFGLQRNVSKLSDAVNYLGLETIKSLVLSIQIFSKFQHPKISTTVLKELFEHSMTTGMFARAIAKKEKFDTRSTDEIFLAGLLHDIGKLVLIINFPDDYAKVLTIIKDNLIPAYEAETQIFGTTHAEVGGYLMGIWGLNDSIVETLTFHHIPKKHPVLQFNSLTAVHVADAILHEFDSGSTKIPFSQMDLVYLADIGVSDKLDEWKAIHSMM